MNNNPTETPRMYTQEEVDALMRTSEQALSTALEQVEALTVQLNELTVKSQDDEITQREKQIQRREMHAQAVERLASQQLPVQLAEALDYTDEERFAASLEAITSLFSQAVQRGVELRLRGTIPTVGTSAVKTTTLREAIEQRYAGV